MGRVSIGRDEAASSTVVAVEQVAHSFSSRRVSFAGAAAIIGVGGALGNGTSILIGTALRAAVGEAGLTGLQLEFFRTNHADFDGVSHSLLRYAR